MLETHELWGDVTYEQGYQTGVQEVQTDLLIRCVRCGLRGDEDESWRRILCTDETIVKIIPMIDMMATGQKIARLRDEAGLSARDLARRMDISYQAVYRWEHGRSIPSIDNLVILAFILGVSMDDVVVTRLMPVSVPERLRL